MKIGFRIGLALFLLSFITQESLVAKEGKCQRAIRICREALFPSNPVFRSLQPSQQFFENYANSWSARTDTSNQIREFRNNVKSGHLNLAETWLILGPRIRDYSYRDLERIEETLIWALEYLPEDFKSNWNEKNQGKLISFRRAILNAAYEFSLMTFTPKSFDNLFDPEINGEPRHAQNLFIPILINALNGSANPLVVTGTEKILISEPVVMDVFGIEVNGLRATREKRKPIEEIVELSTLRLVAAELLARHPQIFEPFATQAYQSANALLNRLDSGGPSKFSNSDEIRKQIQAINFRYENSAHRQDPGSPSE